MNIRELRIGNFVSKDNSNFKLSAYKLYEETRVSHIREKSKYDPVRLNEKWLIKFGFELTGDKYKKGLIKVGIGNSFNSVMINNSYVSISITHVHKLQNLYFCLTGEELTCV